MGKDQDTGGIGSCYYNGVEGLAEDMVTERGWLCTLVEGLLMGRAEELGKPGTESLEGMILIED